MQTSHSFSFLCVCILTCGYVNTDSSGNPLDVDDIIDLDHEYLTYDSVHSNPETVQYYFRSEKSESYRPLHHNQAIDLNAPLCFMEGNQLVCEKGSEQKTKFYHDPDHTAAVAIANENGTIQLKGVVNKDGATYEYAPLESSTMSANRYHVIKKRWTANIVQKRVSKSRNVRRPTHKNNIYKKIPVAPSVDELCVDILFKKKEKSIADTMKKIRYYYSHVVNGINMRYATITEDLRIKVRLAGYFVAKGPKDLSFMDRESMNSDPNYRVDSNYTLTSLDTFLKSKTGNWKSSELPDFNHAMLFLEYARTNIGGSVLGTSFVSGICSGSKGTSLVVDHGAYTSAGIGTHELGHNLGVFFHDGEGPVRTKQCNASFNYIMAPASFLIDESNLRYSFTFSKCSIEQIKKHVDNLVKMNKNCLKCSERKRTKYQDRIIDNEVKGHMVTLPGEVETVHAQCKQLYGDASFMCPPASPEEMCYRMYCYDPKRSACAIISEQMAAPGTPCGSYKICRMGKCIADKNRGRDVPDDCPYPDIPSNGAHCEDASPFMCKNEKFKQKCCTSCSKNFTPAEACKDSHILINGMTCAQLMTSVWGRPGCASDFNVQNMCCLSCKRLLGSSSGSGGILIHLGRGSLGSAVRSSRNSPSMKPFVPRSRSNFKKNTSPPKINSRSGQSRKCEDASHVKFNKLSCAMLVKSNRRFCKDCTVQSYCCKSCKPYMSVYKC